MIIIIIIKTFTKNKSDASFHLKATQEVCCKFASYCWIVNFLYKCRNNTDVYCRTPAQYERGLYERRYGITFLPFSHIFFFFFLLQIQDRCPEPDVWVSGQKAGDMAWIGVHKSTSKYISIDFLKCILYKPKWGETVKICLRVIGCENIDFCD